MPERKKNHRAIRCEGGTETFMNLVLRVWVEKKRGKAATEHASNTPTKKKELSNPNKKKKRRGGDAKKEGAKRDGNVQRNF